MEMYLIEKSYDKIRYFRFSTEHKKFTAKNVLSPPPHIANAASLTVMQSETKANHDVI